MEELDLWERMMRLGAVLAVVGLGTTMLKVGKVLLPAGIILMAAGAMGGLRRRGGFRSLRITAWDCAGILGTLAVMAGISLTVLRYPAGAYVLLAGMAAAAAGILGSLIQAVRHPLRCPRCGAVLTGSRVRKTSLFRKTQDTVTCAGCGAQVDLIALYRENRKRR